MPARATPLRWIAILGILVLSTCDRSREIVHRGCTWPPEVDRAWWGLDGLLEKCGYGTPCWRAALADAARLRDSYPEELMAHRIYGTVLLWSESFVPESQDARDRAVAQYESLARRHPKNPAYPYLLSRLEPNRAAKLELLGRAIALDPGFADARQARTRILGRKPTDAERKLAAEDIDAYLRACPDNVYDIVSLLGEAQDPELWRSRRDALRRIAAADPHRASYLPDLWAREFQFHPPSEFPRLREQVRSDLAELRADASDDPARLATLRRGYELLVDADGMRAVEDETLEKQPCTTAATRVFSKRFDAEHGKRPRSDEAAIRKYDDLWAAALAPRLRECPDEMLLWQYRLSNVGREGAPAAETAEAADGVMRLLGSEGAGMVADVYLDKRLRLDRVPGLIEREDERIDRGEKDFRSAGYPAEDLRRQEAYVASERFYNQVRRARLAVAIGDRGRAALALEKLSSVLDDLSRLADPEEPPVWEEARFHSLQAEYETFAGRPDDALTAYGLALGKKVDDERLKGARNAYVKVHGNDTGFDAWKDEAIRSGRTAAEAYASPTRRPMPDFELTDVAGRKWTKATLAGKVVYVNVWATWCGPCRQELPAVQKLYEKTKNDKSVVVVTVNIDDNPGAIEPFMKKASYTFPVLVAGSNGYGLWSPKGIPQGYVVDAAGTIVRESWGFDGDEAAWLETTEASLRATLAAKPGG